MAGFYLQRQEAWMSVYPPSLLLIQRVGNELLSRRGRTGLDDVLWASLKFRTWEKLS